VSWLVIVLFFVSGATALIGEVVWMRMLGLVLGNTVWAASAAVAVWMGGMALGAGIGARFAPKVRRHLVWYGLAEGLVGVFFALSPWLHRWLLALGARVGADLSDALALAVAQRFGLAVLSLAVPTLMMGLTLPLLVERLRGTGLAARVGLLYGVNTLGATAGVFSTAYVLLPVLGESGALGLAAILCALVAVFAVLADGWVSRPEGQQIERGGGGVTSGTFRLLAAVMGGAALAAELVWVRILVLHLGSRVYAFAILLGAYLLGLGCGSLAVRLAGRRVERPANVLALVQFAAAVAILVQLALLGFTGDIMAGLAAMVPLRFSFVAVQGVMLTTVVVLFAPVTVLFGASFPLATAADPAARSAGGHAGAIAAANTIGGIVGAVFAPFVLVPLIGVQRTLLLLVVVHLGVTLTLVRSRGLVAAVVVVFATVCGVWWTVPTDWVLRRAGTGVEADIELVEIRESVSATVLVKQYHEAAGSWYSLELNGVNVAGSSPALLAVQQLQGHLPLLQVPDPRRVLHVGFGSGGTCWAVTRHPVDLVRVVEISPDVLRAADTYFGFINHHVLDDPRVDVVLNDGRNYLLASEEMYDAILSDSIHPVYAGNSTLYTREYFELCRRRLNPGGVVSMWLPMYSLDVASYLRILAAFHSVFPQTCVWYDIRTINEFTVVTGRRELGPVEIYSDRLADGRLGASLGIAGVETFEDLISNLLVAPQDVGRLVYGIDAHEDDFPSVEYLAGRTVDRTQSWLWVFRMLVAGRTEANPLGSGAEAWPSAVSNRDRRLRRHLERLRVVVDEGD